MENFITGYPGHEFEMRREMKKVLGEEKYDYFFDKFLEYFFTEDDAKLFAQLGLNCLRLPVCDLVDALGLMVDQLSSL